MKATEFEGVVPPGEKVRKDKSHLKFPLYKDEEIGFKLDE